MIETPRHDTETLEGKEIKNNKNRDKTWDKLNKKWYSLKNFSITPENEAQLLKEYWLDKKTNQNPTLSEKNKNENKYTQKESTEDWVSKQYKDSYTKNLGRKSSDWNLSSKNPSKEQSTPQAKDSQTWNLSSSNPSKEKTTPQTKDSQTWNLASNNPGKEKPTPQSESIAQNNTSEKGKEDKENWSITPEKAIAEMREQLWKRYIHWGRWEKAKGFDCSWLITTVLYQNDLRATSSTLYNQKSQKINTAEVKTWDVIYQKWHIQMATWPAIKVDWGVQVPIIEAVGGHVRRVRETTITIPDGSKKYHAWRLDVFSKNKW